MSAPESLEASRAELHELQADRLSGLWRNSVRHSGFYQAKFAKAGLAGFEPSTLDDWQRLPFTTKAELVAEQASYPPYGRFLTEPIEAYTRLHQTSGTQGTPLRWLDTPANWDWMLACWEKMYRIVGVSAEDRLLFAFSFGPFLGFWTAFDAATRVGCLCLAGGGMSSGARLKLLLDHRVTYLLCTPTYALHLAQVAREHGFCLGPDTPGYALRGIIVAGEPGGSIPSTRNRIEEAWQTRVYDHSGLTEIGPMTIECHSNPGGLHVLEEDYYVEILDPKTLRPAEPGELGELIVTNLGRCASPLVRYRTGDLVRAADSPCICGLPWLRLDGGILGRTDDMIAIRGNNFYPSALENVLRRFAEIAEYRVEIDKPGSMSELRIEIEPIRPGETRLAESVAQTIRDELLFRAEVVMVAPGTLPRFEMKAQRWIKRQD